MEEPTPGAERPEPQPESVPAAPRPAGPGEPGGPAEPAGSAEPGPAEPGPAEPGSAEPGSAEPGADGSGAGGPAPAQPAGPEPLGVPVTPTGHADVDERLARLADVDHLAVGGHLPVYEDVHRGLRDTLASLDQQPGPRPAARNDLRS